MPAGCVAEGPVGTFATKASKRHETKAQSWDERFVNFWLVRSVRFDAAGLLC